MAEEHPWDSWPTEPPAQQATFNDRFNAMAAANAPAQLPDKVQFQMHRGQEWAKGSEPNSGNLSQQMKEWSAKQFEEGGEAGAYKGIAGGLGVTAVRASEIGSNIILGLPHAVYDAGTLAGDVMAGKVKSWDDLIPRVTNLAGFLVGGTAFGRSKFNQIGDHPIIPTKTGDLARVTQNDITGLPDAKVIGPPPKEEDFQIAASAIKPNEPAIAQKLKDGWQTYGIHPYEAAEAAARSPVMARDLSSAATPPRPLPPRPNPNFIRETDNSFFKLGTNHQADVREAIQYTKEVPVKMKDPDVAHRMDAYGEGDPTAVLTPEEGKLYNDHVIPLNRIEHDEYMQASKTGLPVEEYDPNYVHRMRKGFTPAIDRLAGEVSEENPVSYIPGRFSQKTSSMYSRQLYAVENAEGERRTVAIKDNKIVQVLKGEKSRTLYEAEKPEDIKPGLQFPGSTGEPWRLTQAYKREIEADTDIEYYHNILASKLLNIVHLKGVNRAITAIQSLRDSPEWAKYTEDATKPSTHPDWITPEMPLFKNDRMDPKMAHVIDEFWGKRDTDGIWNTLEKINAMATRSLFVTPIPHDLNIAGWWATARGWDNITPQGMRSLFMDGSKAIQQVHSMGPDYIDFMRRGSGMRYLAAANHDYYRQILEGVGVEMDRSGEWTGIGRAIGIPSDLIKAGYNSVNRSMWQVGDTMMLQRMYELERKGMSREAAIAEAEKIIPNYRVPSEIFGSRRLQQNVTNPMTFMFMRYHIGELRAYANMAKELAVGTLQQRGKVVGQILAMAATQMILIPAMSAALQDATGEKNLKIPPVGPGRLMYPLARWAVNANPDLWPKATQRYYGDDKGLMTAIVNLLPFSPITRFGIETLANRNLFTGQPIVEPADVREGNVKPIVGQTLEHAAQSLVMPYDQVQQGWKNGKTPQEVLMESAFGLENRTDKQEEAKARAFHHQEKDAGKRTRKPAGPLEQMLGQ